MTTHKDRNILRTLYIVRMHMTFGIGTDDFALLNNRFILNWPF